MEDGEEFRRVGLETGNSKTRENNGSRPIIISMLSIDNVQIQTEQHPDIFQVERSAHSKDYDNDIIAVNAEEADVAKMSNYDELGLCSILRLALKRRLTSFAKDASIAYLSHLVDETSSICGSVARKTLWTLLMLFGVGFMTFQFYDRIFYYLSYPTVTDYRIIYDRRLRFPSVTICPETRASKRLRSFIGKLLKRKSL